MRHFKHIYPVLIKALLLISFASCQDAYIPKELDSDGEILVITGAITNDGGPHKVTINSATPFLTTGTTYISDATVSIEDGDGQEFFLTEQKAGNYYTEENSLIGVPNQSYKLKVMLSNGYQYESEITTMPELHNINSLYAESGEQGSLVENFDGSYIEQIYKGLYIYADMNVTSNEKQYFKFESLIASQSSFSFDTLYEEDFFPTTIIVKCIDVRYLNQVPDVKTTLKSGDQQIIKKHLLGFVVYKRISKYYDRIFLVDGELVTKNQGFSANYDGWVLSINTYAVSRDEYLYYNKVKEQLTATNQIFDPLPSSIRGNITCVTDTTQTVFGYFSVAAKIVFSRGMKWVPGYTSIRYQEVQDYPYISPTSVMNDSIAPPGWINF